MSTKRSRQDILADLHEIEKAARDNTQIDYSNPEQRERVEKLATDHKKYGAELRDFDANVEKAEAAKRDHEALLASLRRPADDPLENPLERDGDEAMDEYGEAIADGFPAGDSLPEISRARSRDFREAMFPGESDQAVVPPERSVRAQERMDRLMRSRRYDRGTTQKRTVTAGGTTAGGNVVPEDTSMYRTLIREMRAYMGVERVARTIVTPNGRQLPFPRIDDTATDFSTTDRNAGPAGDAVGAQTAQSPAENTAMGSATTFQWQTEDLGAHVKSSGAVPLTRQALEDFGPALGAVIYPLMAERIGRLKAHELANGSGAGEQLQGILPAATVTTFASATGLNWGRGVSGFTGNTGTPLTQTVDAQLWAALQHSVDIAYRMGPGSAVVVSDDFLFALKTLRDGENRLQFPEFSMRNWDGGERFGSMRVVVDPNYGSFITGGTVGTAVDVATVGDHSKFVIRRVRGMWMVRDELTMANRHVILYYLSERCDSAIVSPRALRKVQVTPRA